MSIVCAKTIQPLLQGSCVQMFKMFSFISLNTVDILTM